MAVVKKLNSSYTLDTTDVYILGNLIVKGTYDTQTVTNTNIVDKDITLNAGEASPSGVAGGTGTSGISIYRGGTLANVQLLWNEAFDKWQLTNNGTTYSNIATSTTGLTAVVEDLAPVLGGNLNTNGYTILTSTTNVRFAGNLQLNNTAVAPSLVTGATVLYSATPGSGTSGIYVVNQTATNEELVTKTRSFGFSLIL